MKYPTQQFKHLVSGLRELSKFIDLKGVNPSQLHYIVYQQASLGQTHNWIYWNGSKVSRAHSITDMKDWHKVVMSVPETFELYPDGCYDSHIETAVKKALKVIGD